MENKCKKHNRKLIDCTDDHYGDQCDCFPKCEVCVRVSKKKYDREMKKCNYAMTVTNNPSIQRPDIIAFKYKPRHRLKYGDYAIIDYKTGYLIKATNHFVQYFVIK